jgi:hypothetical protein
MFDRVLDEIVRAKEAPQPQHLRRWQQHIQQVVLPALARLAVLEAAPETVTSSESRRRPA